MYCHNLLQLGYVFEFIHLCEGYLKCYVQILVKIFGEVERGWRME